MVARVRARGRGNGWVVVLLLSAFAATPAAAGGEDASGPPGRLEAMGRPSAAHGVLTDLVVFDDALIVASAVRPLALPGAAIWRTEDGVSFRPILEEDGSEGFLRLRVIDGVLYAPDADPPGVGNGRIFRSRDGRRFESETIAGVVHSFDVATLGGEVVASGATVDYRGALHRRTDRGWTKWRDLPAQRGHFLLPRPGALFVGLAIPVRGVDFVRLETAKGSEPVAVRDVPGRPYTTRWFVRRDGSVYWSYRDRERGRDQVRVLPAGSAASGWQPVPGLEGRYVSGFAEHEGKLFALAARGLFEERDDGRFVLVASAPNPRTFAPVRVDDVERSLDGSASLVVWRDELWCGSSSDGRLYRYRPAIRP